MTGVPWFQHEVAKYDKICEEAYVASKKETALQNRLWLDSPWHGFFEIRDPMKPPTTGVNEETLRHISQVISTEPDKDFVLHAGNTTLIILL